MATQTATFIFALPENEDSDQLHIYEGNSETTATTQVATPSYSYGTTTYEYTSLDDTKWYTIRFYDSTTTVHGPRSKAVFGGDFSLADPFLAVSTGTDGAQFATVQDVYDYSTLTATEVSRARVSQALRRGRAVIDLRTVELDLDRFTRTWDTAASRKKWNAQLRVLREAEINIALGNVYRGMSDDLVIDGLNDTDDLNTSLSIGQTSIGFPGSASRLEHVAQLLKLGDRYLAEGMRLLGDLQPNSVRIHAEPDDQTRSPRFRLPFNGF